MRKKRNTWAVAVCAAALFSMSGCFAGSVDELYGLPQPAEQYLHLRELIESEISGGSEYSAPAGGAFRQSIQLCDIDGDGADEALVFLRGKDAQPYINIYAGGEGGYALAAAVKGEGSAVGSVEYADLDRDGILDIVIEWQSGGVLKMLSAYSLRDWVADILLTCDSSGFKVLDIDGDGGNELLCVRTEEGGGSVASYRFAEGREPEVSTAKLSDGLETLDRLRAAALADGSPALFAEGKCEETKLMTDIFVFAGGRLTNITRDGDTGRARTVRDYPVYSRDINRDRALEVPDCAALPRLAEDAPVYWLFDWYSYKPDGTRERVLSTYHCYNDGWYLVMPESARGSFAVRRDDRSAGERRVVVSEVGKDGAVTDLMVIYTLTGDNRHDRAGIAGRFTLREESMTVYAAELLGDPESLPQWVSRAELAERFDLIYSEWNTGSL